MSVPDNTRPDPFIDQNGSLSRILDALETGIIILDHTGRLIGANNWFRKAADLSDQEIKGHTLEELFPSLKGSRFFARIEESIRNKHVVLLSSKLNKRLFPLTNKNGEKTDQSIIIKPIDLGNSTFVYVIQIEDISGASGREKLLRQRTTELESNRKYLDSVIQNTGEGVITIDKNGTITTFNRACENLFGYSNDEIFGQNFSTLIPDRLENIYKKYLRNEKSTTPRIFGLIKTLKAKRKDGTFFPIELSLSPMGNEGERKFVGIVRDISDRINAEKLLKRDQEELERILDSRTEKLRKSEERYALVAKGTKDGLWDWDLETGEKYFSPRCNEIMGYEQNRSLEDKENFSQIIHAEDLENIKRATNEHLLNRKPYDLEYRLQHKNGQYIWIHAKGQAIWSDTGKPLRMAGSISDITEKRNSQEELKTARNQAITANKAKTDFLTAMSHELRTPLNAIIGFSEMIHLQLLGNIGDKRYAEYGHDIERSGKHLLDLVNGILDLGRIEAGKYDLTLEPVNITDIIDECIQLLSLRAKKGGISLGKKVAVNLPPLNVDRRSLFQILINLLTNAIKFTDNGGSIVISATSWKSGHKLEVWDTGIGIRQDRLMTITDPFTRHEKNPHLAQTGSGLGLAISKSLVELHQGELTIVSEVGVGTLCTVILPASDLGKN